MNVVFLGAANPETGRMIKAIKQLPCDFRPLGFIDNDLSKKGKTFLGFPIFGGFEILDELIAKNAYFVNLITGSTKTRYETSFYMAKQGCRFTNFIHPSVDLTMSRIGTGNYIQEGVIIQAATRIGNNSSIHTAAIIAHEVTIGNSVFIAHACSISGCVKIGDGAFIGTNATILPHLQIGKWATVGAGAVVFKDVPDYTTVIGNPAKAIRIDEPIYMNGDIFDKHN